MKEAYKRYPVTMGLVIVTVVAFLLLQVLYFGSATSSQAIFEFGGMYGRYVRYVPSELWRLVTPIFIHIGWQHFLFNIFALYIVGQIAEQIWGSWRFLILYILSGVMGNILTLFLTPDVVAAGASTSLFGLSAALGVVGYYGRNPYMKQLGRSQVGVIVANLVLNLFMPNVGIVGHIGGALGGLLLAFCLPTAYEPFLFTKTQRWLAGLAYVAIGLLCLVISFVHP